jgi:hypothetical protein
VLVVSDGLQARIGSLTANQEWFKVWREPDGSPPPSPPTSLTLGEGSRRQGEGAQLRKGSEHYRAGFDFAGPD